MKSIITKLNEYIVITVLMVITLPVLGQSITKYNYVEIIVFQQIKHKKKSEFKRIYLNSSPVDNINSEKLKPIKNNAELLEYMNDNNWELFNRIVERPCEYTYYFWISYIFRKKRE